MNEWCKDPPKDLTDEGKRLWGLILEDIQVDTAAYMVLTLMIEAWERCQLAADALRKEGLVIKDRFGVNKKNPWADVLRDNALNVDRMYKSLGLHLALPGQGKLF